MSATTTTIDAQELLKAIIAKNQAELALLTSAEEVATRDRIRRAQLLGLEQSVKLQEEAVDKFPALIEAAYNDLKTAVAERHVTFRQRFHLPESNVGVHRAVSHLTSLLNGQCEQTLTLSQVREKYDAARRLEDSITAQQKPQD